MISAEEIFSIRTEGDFNDTALEIFAYQAMHCNVYGDYIKMLGIQREGVKSLGEIPFLPVEFFKTHEVLSNEKKPEIIFESSGTTGAIVSRHYVADKEIYTESFTRCFEQFYGKTSDYCILALLPSYLERENS